MDFQHSLFPLDLRLFCFSFRFTRTRSLYQRHFACVAPDITTDCSNKNRHPGAKLKKMVGGVHNSNLLTSTLRSNLTCRQRRLSLSCGSAATPAPPYDYVPAETCIDINDIMFVITIIR